MSLKENDIALEELQVFLEENEINLDNVKFDESEGKYFHILDEEQEVHIYPDNTATQHIKEIQYIPQRLNTLIALLTKSFEVVDLGSSKDYLDFETINLN